jgi:hypothetical protein
MLKFAHLFPLVAFVAASIPASALAYDGEITGILKFVHIKGNSSADSLTLELTSGASLCGSGTPAVTSLAATNYAYQAMVSTANAALLSGRQVKLYSDWDGSACVLKQIRLL